MRQKISAIMVIHNEEKLVERALRSLGGVVDEILVLHDGPCSDDSLKICKKYTKKVFATKNNTGVPGPILPILFRKARGPWILKIDADEILSREMRENISELVENKDADAYTFRWPLWDGSKYITKNWPRKLSLYRKSKMSYLGFPHFDDPQIDGKIINTPYQLMHKPILKNPLFGWQDLIHKVLYRYGGLQARWTLKSFEELDKFQYKEKDLPRSIRIRKEYPLLSAVPMAVLGFFRVLSNGAWKEGLSAFKEAGQTFIYYLYVGYKIYKLKKNIGGINFKKC